MVVFKVSKSELTYILSFLTLALYTLKKQEISSATATTTTSASSSSTVSSPTTAITTTATTAAVATFTRSTSYAHYHAVERKDHNHSNNWFPNSKEQTSANKDEVEY